MIPTPKSALENTYHRDGSVSFFDVYLQSWSRCAADHISDQVLASMDEDERSQIAKHADRYPVPSIDPSMDMSDWDDHA